MLDAYSSVGMPLMYRHWSFGKRFVYEEHLYRKGRRGLAYELVINSNPCISYLMEENTMAMQALVTAHAAFGHNHFFKNNYLFRQWTDAGAILSYMEFAKGFIARCEERHGVAAVEPILDAAHALMEQGVFRYRRPPRLSSEKEREGRARTAGIRGARLQRSVADAAALEGEQQAGEAERGAASARRRSTCRRRTCSISWRRTAWCWSHGSARCCGSCASSRSISIRSARPR